MFVDENAKTKRDDGIPPNQTEYKTRRLVNDDLQPPKVTAKMLTAQARFEDVRHAMETEMCLRQPRADARLGGIKGCTVCVDLCLLDVLRIAQADGGAKTAYMKYGECWYGMPCEADCPTGPVTVNLPFLLR